SNGATKAPSTRTGPSSCPGSDSTAWTPHPPRSRPVTDTRARTLWRSWTGRGGQPSIKMQYCIAKHGRGHPPTNHESPARLQPDEALSPPNGTDPSMATATVHTRTELRVFYSLVLGLALYGQSTGASSWLVPDDASHLQAALLWVLVIAFVLVLELGAVVLLRRAETQRRAGERAWVAIFAAIVLAGGAAGLSWIGHWGTSTSAQIQSWAFAGATLLGVLVWAIMADLSIDATVSRHRAVESAVRRYVKDLSMDGSEKAVLLATMDVRMITQLITGGPDALGGADGRDRNVRIAHILARAIDPDTWHGQEAKPAAKKAAGAAAPAPALVSTPAS